MEIASREILRQAQDDRNTADRGRVFVCCALDIFKKSPILKELQSGANGSIRLRHFRGSRPLFTRVLTLVRFFTTVTRSLLLQHTLVQVHLFFRTMHPPNCGSKSTTSAMADFFIVIDSHFQKTQYSLFHIDRF